MLVLKRRIYSFFTIVMVSIAVEGLGKTQVDAENNNIADKHDIVSPHSDDDYKNKNVKTQPEKDSDGDGVPDKDDWCPFIAGSIKAHGCPDADDDGIPDFIDDCPYEAGLPEFNGCPDTDGDGIPDNKDACPYEKGPVSNNGCPVKKKAKDNDDDDSITTKVVEIPYNKLQDSSRTIIQKHEPDPAQITKDRNYYLELSKNLEIEASMLADSADRNLFNNQEHHSEPAEHVNIAENKPPVNVNPEFASQPKFWRVLKRDIIISNEETKLLDAIFNNLTFLYGRNIMDNKSTAMLDKFADLLKRKFSWTIIVHCYTNEAANTYRNQQLAYNRADFIRSFLVGKGIDVGRIQIRKSGDTPDQSNMPPNRIEIDITR